MVPPRIKYVKGVVLFGMLFAVGAANSQDLDPRRYVNLPVGQNFLAGTYTYSEGDVNVSPSIPLDDAFLRIDGPAVVYARTFSIAGNSASVDVFLPYVCAAGNALLDGERVSRTVCGQGDTQLRINYNFVGAPAMEVREFVKREKGVVVGASIGTINAPRH